MEIKNVLRLLYSLTAVVVVLAISAMVMLIVYYTTPQTIEQAFIKPEWKVKNPLTDIPQGSEGKMIRYGFSLISESAKYLGPKALNPEQRYAGNNLACKNCHLDNGTKAGSASWVGVTGRFPQFRGRENKIGTIEERVNGCMQRSMNGRPLPVDSKEMQAIVAYMDWLGEDLPEDKEADYKGFTKVKLPDYAADPVKGKLVYEAECQVCHGENGQGIQLADGAGYQYPPLWGTDTYNHGAGMYRVITAAQFIKGNMPFGQATVDNPKLSDEEAYHVAAYINSFERPMKSNPEADFPDKKLKPVSTPYGPWEDDFSPEQHKYGPFPPMMAYYQEAYGIKKSK